MLTTLLVMAITMNLQPARIGFGVFMLNRPQPMLQLLAFLCTAFAMAFGVGLVVLLILRATPLAAMNLTVPEVRIGIGLLALLVALVLATNISTRNLIRRPLVSVGVGGDAAVVAVEAAPPSVLEKISSRARHLLQSSSLWVAAGIGLGFGCPDAGYLAAMAVILACPVAPGAQVGVLLAFNVVAFAIVEIPLVTYLLAPEKTCAAVAALQAWIRSRRRRDVAALLAAAGCCWVAVGMGGL
jgi:hypothetical protein